MTDYEPPPDDHDGRFGRPRGQLEEREAEEDPWRAREERPVIERIRDLATGIVHAAADQSGTAVLCGARVVVSDRWMDERPIAVTCPDCQQLQAER